MFFGIFLSVSRVAHLCSLFKVDVVDVPCGCLQGHHLLYVFSIVEFLEDLADYGVAGMLSSEFDLFVLLLALLEIPFDKFKHWFFIARTILHLNPVFEQS